MNNSPEFGFVTKADQNFYDGLIALLASLRTWHPEREVTVVDCGLTMKQLQAVSRYPLVKIVKAENGAFNIPDCMKQYYTSAIYGFFSVHEDLYPVTVHIDADAVVLGDIEDLVLQTLAGPVGIAAVPDYPHLDLAFQMGSLDGAFKALTAVLENPELDSVSFNGGVFAIRADYYQKYMKPWVDRLIPSHEYFWGNDMAIMNFAAYAANREQAFVRAGHIYNTRADYRRAPDLPKNKFFMAPNGRPLLEGPFGPIKVLHFVGKQKPWAGFDSHEDSFKAWRFYRDIGKDWFEE